MEPKLAALLLAASAALAQTGVHWPSFRGPQASGISEGSATPTRWHVARSDNVRWKTPIPGLGHSSPVIWGDRIFLATAVDLSGRDSHLKVGLYGDVRPVTEDGRQDWKVLCLDKKTGRMIWEKTAHSGTPIIKRHPKATHANTTVATDGKYIVAFFGSEGLYCYDFDGTLIWKKDLGRLDSGFFIAPDAQWGFASSPVIHGGKVIVQCDVQENSFLAAFSLGDGEELWRTARDEVPTWSTPTIHDSKIIVNGFRHIGAYDVDTGKSIWRFAGGGDVPTPTPVIAHGHAYITNSHGGKSPIYAVRLDATGELSPAKGITWSHERGGAYMGTPLVYGNYLYVCRTNGVLGCYLAKTGVKVYERRLGGGRTGFTASMVASGGKIYVPSEDGDIYVVRAGPEFEILATNSMDEVVMASPAISQGVLYIRTRAHLYAVGD